MDILRSEQARYDEVGFDLGYRDLGFRDEKVEHIGAHLGKIIGIKALHWATSEWEHPERLRVVTEEVIPDLSIYRTQMVNITGVPYDPMLKNAEEEYSGGIMKPTKRDVHARLVEVRGLIDDYIEPIKHGKDPDLIKLISATLKLHSAVVRIGEIYGYSEDDMAERHLGRLIGNAKRLGIQYKQK